MPTEAQETYSVLMSAQVVMCGIAGAHPVTGMHVLSILFLHVLLACTAAVQGAGIRTPPFLWCMPQHFTSRGRLP